MYNFGCFNKDLQLTFVFICCELCQPTGGVSVCVFELLGYNVFANACLS